jgi:ribosome modulation factor
MLDADLDLVWTEGYVAGHAVQPLTNNPYHHEPRRWNLWTTGWRDGRTDELRERLRSRRHGRAANA